MTCIIRPTFTSSFFDGHMASFCIWSKLTTTTTKLTKANCWNCVFCCYQISYHNATHNTGHSTTLTQSLWHELKISVRPSPRVVVNWSARCPKKLPYSQKRGELHFSGRWAKFLFVSPPFPGEQMNFWERFKCYIFFYDNKILNPKLAPNWFSNVKVIDITSDPALSWSGPICYSQWVNATWQYDDSDSSNFSKWPNDRMVAAVKHCWPLVQGRRNWREIWLKTTTG